jgi:5-methylcytosine-specific restriction endonuclease McrBC GTP-binding regulatory subunit McrB
MKERTPNYWLFQSNPKVFRLRDALRAEAVHTAAVRAHQSKMEIGDRVILWEAGKNAGCYALATIVSEVAAMEVLDLEKDYYKELPKLGDRVQLKIDYNLWNKPITKEILPNSTSFQEFYAGLPGSTFKATKQQFDQVKNLIETQDVVNEPIENYARLRSRHHPLNLILYGPPGTGKTFQTVNYALSILENRSLSELVLEERTALRDRFENFQNMERIGFVTFHQSFAYEDFMEGIKPIVTNGNVQYEVEDGIFKRLCQQAAAAWETAKSEGKPAEKYIFIIDEINRGNVASIFGELITLVEKDKRAGASEALQVTLPYSKKTFSIPPNLHILATMNTTDRSVEAFDVALRRRFDFIEKMPNPSLIPSLATHPVAAGVDLEKLLTAINQRIEILLDSAYCLGHSYFLDIATLADLQHLFGKKIIPLLQEYFFNDLGKIGLILGTDFIKTKKYGGSDVFANFDHEMASEWAEKKVFELKKMTELTEADFIRIYKKEYIIND